MKRLITILLALILISCQDELAFEDYIKWCNETVTTKEVVFDIEGDIYGNRFTIYSDAYPSKRTIDDVNNFLKDSTIKVVHLEVELIDVTTKRCEPTIKGYQDWKEDIFELKLWK